MPEHDTMLPTAQTVQAGVEQPLSSFNGTGVSKSSDCTSSGHGSWKQSIESLPTDVSEVTYSPPPCFNGLPDAVIPEQIIVDTANCELSDGVVTNESKLNNGDPLTSAPSESVQENGLMPKSSNTVASQNVNDEKEDARFAGGNNDEDSDFESELADEVPHLPDLNRNEPLFVELQVTPVAPDGGWGWVIVVVSFLCSSFVDGLCSVFGVLLPNLVMYFGQSSTSTVAVAGSLLAGGFLLWGPVASVLINCFGCRETTIIGSVLTSVALFSSTFASNVVIFILLFGGIGGLGLSLLYLPASVMVGYYFEQKRGLAAGIASSGAGFGMLVLSPLVAALAVEYDWKGALIILAGVTLNCMACGGLMRPLPPPCIPANPTIRDLSGLDLKKMDEVASLKPRADDELSCAISIHSRRSRDTSSQPHRVRCYSEMKAGDSVPRSVRPSISLVASQPGEVRYRSCAELQGSIQTPSTTDHMLTSPLQRKDIFYSGSVISLRSGTCPVVTTPLPVESNLDPPQTCCSCAPRTFVTLFQMLDVTLFKNFAFLVICVSSVFIQLGYFVPVVFMTPYAQSLGISASNSAFLLSVIGISNMIGRSGAGALATLPRVNNLHFNNISLMVTGLATALVPFISTGYTSLIVYSIVFGLSVAVFVPLTTVFLVQYVGLEKLTNAFGLLSMVKGVATMIGPPVAGALYDSTQTYTSSFIFAGGMFAFAGIMFYLLPVTQRTRKCPSACVHV